MLKIELPWPPTGNTAARHSQFGHYLNQKVKSYRATVATLVRTKTKKEDRIMEGGIKVLVHMYPPDRRRRDIDNAWKTAGDALTNALAWGDDSQIKRLYMHMNEPDPKKRGYITVNARVIK